MSEHKTDDGAVGMRNPWTSLVVWFEPHMWGRKEELYAFVRLTFDLAKAQAKAWQVYGPSPSDKRFHISFRFLNLRNREELFEWMRQRGYRIELGSTAPYEESELWLRAGQLASKWVLEDLAARSSDTTTPDREFLFYIIHALHNNLFLSYQDESEIFTRLQKWAQRKIEAETGGGGGK